MANPLPITCDRVILRRLSEDDLASFQAYRQDVEVARYQGWEPQTDAEAVAFICAKGSAPLFSRGQWSQIGIAERGTNTLIGDIGVFISSDGASAEIGFSLSRQSQGRGLGAESVSRVLQLLFQVTEVGRIEGVTDSRNHPSIRLLERIGMQRVSTRPAEFKGETCLEHTYAIARPVVAPHVISRIPSVRSGSRDADHRADPAD